MSLKTFLRGAFPDFPQFESVGRKDAPDKSRAADGNDKTALAAHDGMISIAHSSELSTKIQSAYDAKLRDDLPPTDQMREQSTWWGGLKAHLVTNGEYVLQSVLHLAHCQMANHVFGPPDAPPPAGTSAATVAADSFINGPRDAIEDCVYMKPGDVNQLSDSELTAILAAADAADLFDVEDFGAFEDEITGQTPQTPQTRQTRQTRQSRGRALQVTGFKRARRLDGFKYKLTSKTGVTDLQFAKRSPSAEPMVNVEAKLDTVWSKDEMLELVKHLKEWRTTIHLVRSAERPDGSDADGIPLREFLTPKDLPTKWRDPLLQIFTSMMVNKVRLTLLTNGHSSVVFEYTDGQLLVSDVFDHTDPNHLSLVELKTALPLYCLADNYNSDAYPKPR